jgi:hypothetical protein
MFAIGSEWGESLPIDFLIDKIPLESSHLGYGALTGHARFDTFPLIFKSLIKEYACS